MANVLIGAPIYSDVGVLETPTFDASGDWEAGNPLTNLQDRALWTIARSTSAAPEDTRLAINLGRDRAVRVVMVPKHNLSTTAKWRVVGRPSTNLFSYVAGEDLAARGAVFSRSGTATFVDRAGVVRTAADGVPRDGHWINGERTLLLEPARTNLCIRSEEFNTWTDVNANCAVTPNAITAPDGTLTADLLTAGGASAIRRRTVTFTGDGEKCYAVYLKAGTSAQSRIQIRDTTAAVERHRVTVTWTDGVPTLSTASGAGTLYPVEPLFNGWYRLSISATGVVAANTNTVDVWPDPLNNTGTVYAWGAQAEDAVVPSSYIKTEGSPVTRNADSLYFPFNAPPQAMTVYVRQVHLGAFSPNTGLSRRFLSISDATISPARFAMNGSSADNSLQVNHVPTAGSVSSFVGGGTVVAQGDVVEARGVLYSSGSVVAARSINGGTEAVGATSAASALDGAWSAQRLYIAGMTGASAAAYTHIAVAAGEQTMDAMRASYYDSGWIDAWPSGWDAETAENLNLPLLHVLPSDYAAEDWSLQFHDEDNADGYLDLHRLCITGAYEPSVNFTTGAEVTHESDSTTRYADAGNAVHDQRPLRRVSRFTIQNLDDAEAFGQAFRTMRRLGAKGQCVLVLRPDATADLLPETSFLAVPRELTRLEYPYAMYRDAAFAFTEEL